jgi:hypothetical protein
VRAYNKAAALRDDDEAPSQQRHAGRHAWFHRRADETEASFIHFLRKIDEKDGLMNPRSFFIQSTHIRFFSSTIIFHPVNPHPSFSHRPSFFIQSTHIQVFSHPPS